MRKKLQAKMFELSYFFELFISIIVGVAITILSVRLLIETLNMSLYQSGASMLVEILDNAIILAIGAELIKMLCKHTPETVIEVLAFALARQLIIGHASAWENLVMVISIAVLFVIRRFLLQRYDFVETPDGLIKIEDEESND